jgi:hypothetical protein
VPPAGEIRTGQRWKPVIKTHRSLFERNSQRSVPATSGWAPGVARSQLALLRQREDAVNTVERCGGEKNGPYWTCGAEKTPYQTLNDIPSAIIYYYYGAKNRDTRVFPVRFPL